MPPLVKTDPRYEAIRRALARRQGPDSRPEALSGAALGLWREVGDRLAPMIGTRGVEALVSRALQLTAPAFPWLVPAGKPPDDGNSMTAFQACLEGRDPAAVQAASVALLVTFTSLLAAMIGPSLTDRLLNPIWAPPDPPSTEATHHE